MTRAAGIEADAITPVILCGGSGMRLWPLSRKSYPKQFAALAGDESLFARTVARLKGPGFAAPVAVTGVPFRFITAEQMLGAGSEPAAILLEPEARNTAPAVLAAALWLAERDAHALMLIAPSDHMVADEPGLRSAILGAVPEVREGRIVVFGVVPDRAETGYGWIAPEGRAGGEGAGPVAVRQFVEKPAPDMAASLLAGGGHLWNMGMFLCTPASLIAAFQSHAPDLLAPVGAAVAEARPDLGFLRLDPGGWARARAVSLDYAVIERATNLSVQRVAGGWSDLGDWASVGRELSGPHISPSEARAVAIDCKDTLLRAESEDQALVGIGLSGIIAVAMPDAVLVADRSRAQDVRLAVAALTDRGSRQAMDFLRDHRPWGWFEVLARGPRFQVKRISVKPGGRLSLQRHVHRAEHWVVVTGTARVTIDGNVALLGENQSTYIPLGAAHRLENPGKVATTLIEVQTGGYLGEDDIERLDDAYARGAAGGD